MTAFRADLEALDDLVARLRAFDARAEQLGADLDTDARRLGSFWNGPAASAHQAAHERWMAAHRRVGAAADELARLVRTARENYAAAAASNVRMWG
jgi:WXG100 family type VII secretion target